jgi:hypothetical protein
MDGQPKSPISLNKYAYASNAPIDNVDPLGLMTLGDVGASLDIQGILGNIARDQISSYVQSRIFGCSEADNAPPCLFDILMGQMIKSIAGSLNVAGAVVPVVLGGPRSGEKHHTVPKYMCGHESQELVYLSVAQHRKLHLELYEFKVAINIAGALESVVFQKKIKGVSAVQDMAKREAGRGAIAAGLALFYYLDGYNGTEWAALGSGVKSHLPLGYVFPIEAARYELGHYNKGKCPDDDDE